MQHFVRQHVAIWALYLCASAILATASSTWATPTPTDAIQHDFLASLSTEEQTWLQAHPDISIGTMLAWPPLNFVDATGTPRGLGMEYIQALNLRLGGILRPVPGAFQSNLQAVKAKNLDALMDVSPKPEREEFLNFTRQYLNIPHAIIASTNGRRFHSEQDLRGYTLALETGFYNVTYFRTKYPSCTIREYSDTARALDAVSRGEADAYVGNRAVATWIMEQELMSNLQVQGRADQPGSILTIGVRKDWPELASIFDKALADLRVEEVQQIHQRCTRRTPDTGIDTPAHISFTHQEQTWLKDHPELEIGVMDAWPPMDYVNEYGNPVGIGAMFIHQLNKQLDGALKIKPGPWKDIYDAVKEQHMAGLMGITPSADRKAFFNFTTPYVTVPHVIVARKDSPYAATLADLQGKQVAVEIGFFLASALTDKYPDIAVKEYADTSAALDAVSKGEADAYVGNRAVALYLIEKELISNLVFQGTIQDTASVNAIGVRKDWPILRDILQKALDNMSMEDRHDIVSHWISPQERTAPQAGKVMLTPEERAWISAHPHIRIGIGASWAPFVYKRPDGALEGFDPDFLAMINQLAGTNIQLVAGPWQDIVGQAQNGTLDGLAESAVVDSRREHFTFTNPYNTVEYAAATTPDKARDIRSRADLRGKRIAHLKGNLWTGKILSSLEDVRPVEAASEE